MEISEFVWTEDRISHVARHAVHPEEFEDVCFGKALVLRAKPGGKNLSITSWERRKQVDTSSAS